MPGATGYGVSCPECEEPEIWAGQSYDAHTEAHHAGVRRRRLVAVLDRLRHLAEVRQNQALAQAEDCVVVQWRSGVYGRQLPDHWWVVPCEWWDDMGPDEGRVLRSMRVHLSAELRRTHGVGVNPATWFHRVHDWRERHSEACVCEACRNRFGAPGWPNPQAVI